MHDTKIDLVWHYTSWKALKGMLYHDFIKTYSIPPYARAAVWFSTIRTWEPTVFNNTKTPDIRIGVTKNTARHSWQDFLAMSGIDKAYADGLASSGIQQGSSPMNWFVSFDDVSRSQWISVQERSALLPEWTDVNLPKRPSKLHLVLRRLRDPLTEWLKQICSKYTMGEYHRFTHK